MNIEQWINNWYQNNAAAPTYREVYHSVPKGFAPEVYRAAVQKEAAMNPWLQNVVLKGQISCNTLFV